MDKYLHHIVALIVLTILVGVLTWTNHVPGTMLAGWDDLHHEFNFQLAFTRTIQGVWRADQGLGAVAGHSHMSDIPRIIILWIISLIVPLQNIRFVFVILSLFVGALGMYVFVYYLFNNLSLRGALATWQSHINRRIRYYQKFPRLDTRGRWSESE
jgi:hypothetical protein